MKNMPWRQILISSSYSIILLVLALCVRDIPNEPDAFSLTLQQLINSASIGMQDPKTFATAALDIAQNGWLSDANQWILTYWPPGFFLLEALTVRLFGSSAPIILVLQVVAVALYTVLLTLIYRLVSEQVHKAVAFLLPLVIFVFPVSRVFLLHPTGIALGESFAIAFFLIGFLVLLHSLKSDTAKLAPLAGLLLALSAYFRSQFEFIVLTLTLWGVVLAIITYVVRHYYTYGPKINPSILKSIIITLAVAHLVMLPWRCYNLVHLGKLKWVQTSKGMFINSVLTSEYLSSIGGGFVVEGAGNLTCRIDPNTCGDKKNAKKLFIKTFLSHPVQWYSIKIGAIGSYWYSNDWNQNKSKCFSRSNRVFNTLLIIIPLVALAGLIRGLKKSLHYSYIIHAWFISSLISAYFIIFTVAHFEVRYFYFPKIAGIVIFILLACQCYGDYRSTMINKNPS